MQIPVFRHLWFLQKYRISLYKKCGKFINNTTINKKLYKLYLVEKDLDTLFYNNLELTSVQFMNRQEVQTFVNAVDKSYGQFIYRWGDAPLRYAILTMFAEEKSVQIDMKQEDLGGETDTEEPVNIEISKKKKERNP
ncbi:hypothetical protein KUTeg_023667 [Tegillarca granosa]|uniref:Uncharacterized protein n=1 Tax=Tegillarca granosa TaxID=220873 RepID=A0ABQ9E7S7_TEGGR|nr:hypothetical protein KUTeg_023667 [Tegillarca granosa]